MIACINLWLHTKPCRCSFGIALQDFYQTGIFERPNPLRSRARVSAKVTGSRARVEDGSGILHEVHKKVPEPLDVEPEVEKVAENRTVGDVFSDALAYLRIVF